VVNVTSRQLYPRERDPVSILEEAGWAPGPVWTVRKSSLPPGFDDRIAQAVASPYTDRATSAQRHVYVRTTNRVSPSALCQQLCPSGPRGAADRTKKSFAVVSCLHYSMANLDPGVSFIPVQCGCNKNSNTANSSLRDAVHIRHQGAIYFQNVIRQFHLRAQGKYSLHNISPKSVNKLTVQGTNEDFPFSEV
jgi:hypothetical protein